MGRHYNAPLTLPYLTTTQRDALAGVVNGDLIYNTTVQSAQCYYNGIWSSLNVDSPLASLITRHGGIFVGKRALDKWRYTINPNRTVVVVGDSLAQGNVGGEDPWPERLARDLGNWNGPRLTAGAGIYGLYRSSDRLGGLANGLSNGDGEWFPWGTWTNVAATLAYDLAPYGSTFICPDASATAIRTVADGVTTINTVAITSATLAFVAGDVGALITGTNIPPNTRIASVQSGTAARLNQRATATGSSLAFSIHGANLTWTRPLSPNGARYLTDSTTTNTSVTVVCPGANFQTRDIGRALGWLGGNLPVGAVIATVVDTQTVTVSLAATASATTNRFILHDGRTVTDAVTTNTSTTITSATAKFVSSDVNARVIGTNIPAGTYIVSVQSPTACTISQAATGTGTALPLLINTYRASRVSIDMVTNGTTTVTSATAAFTSADVGLHVTGSNIPNNTTIVSVTNATTAVLSNTVTGSNVSGVLTIGSATPTTVAALGILWVDGIASNGTNFTYSTDGGTTWVQVAQTTTGGPILKQTVVTVTNPTTLIIRANTGPGNSPTTKSQTIQCGVIAYQTVPTTPAAPGIQVYNMARDGDTLTNLVHGGIGDSLAFLDNGGSGWPGLRPDLVIVLFSNDIALKTETQWVTAINRLLDRVQSYADVIFIGPYDQSGAGPRPLATTLAFNADLLAACSSTTTQFKCTDGVTTNASATITSATIGFTQADVGRAISDTAGKIPGGATITAVASATSATISANATGTTSANTFTITGKAVDTGSAMLDLYQAWKAQGVDGYTAANADGLMYDTLHPSQIGHNEIGGRMSRLLRVFS